MGKKGPVMRVVRNVWDTSWNVLPKRTYVDTKTGEVKDGWGPSLVDSSGYETIESMVVKFFKGELRPNMQDVYEFGPDIDPNIALEMMNPLLARGVDRVDAVNFIKQSQGILSELKRKQSGNASALTRPAGDAPPPQASPLGEANAVRPNVPPNTGGTSAI